MSSTPSKTLLTFSNLTSEQQEAITRLVEYDYTLLIAAKGFGKCAVAQTAAQELLDEQFIKKVLVVAPPKVGLLTWAEEWRKWTHLEEIGVALGTPRDRDAVLTSSHRIVVISADSLDWFFKRYSNFHGFDGIVLDEISRFKAVGGVAVKALRRKLEAFKWRVGLSATPVAESGLDIYAQALLLDGGLALGRNVEKFKHLYFMQTDYQGYDFDFQIGGQERLAKALAGLVWVADGVEYEAGLPELVDKTVGVELDAASRKAYVELTKTMLLGDEVEAANAAVLSGKLQQVTQGAVYRDDGSTQWLHHRKFDRLKSLVIEIERPVVICYQFKFELEYLRRMYPLARVLADDPAGAVAAWNSREADILLIHPRSAGAGLNLQQGGADMIMLGPLWSSGSWDQTIGRLWRRGQTEIVHRWIIIAEGTIDGVILKRLDGKSNAENVLMQHLKEVTQK